VNGMVDDVVDSVLSVELVVVDSVDFPWVLEVVSDVIEEVVLSVLSVELVVMEPVEVV